MPYCEITPEQIQVLGEHGQRLAAWPDPTLFDELVWAGCPLIQDPTDSTGAILIDIDLGDMTVLQTTLHKPRAVHIPLTGPPRALVHRWLRQHQHECE